MTENTQTPPTHGWVAERIGFSIAGVSLLRSGRRHPSIPTMEAIEAAFDWSMADQINARKDYAANFERVIQEAHQRTLLDQQSNPVAD